MKKILNILVVDDSLIMRKNLQKNIEAIGHNVISEAGDGETSIAAYRKLKPDLVTMDITMSGMDGITAVKKIKQIDTETNIIMITSHGQEIMVMNALKAGAKGYILKPVTPEKLNEAISRVFPDFVSETEELLLEN